MGKDTETRVHWKQCLFEARALRKKTGGHLYDRTKLLIDIFNDVEFRSDNGIALDKAASDYLDREVNEVFCKFNHLKDILGMFPNRNQWETGNLPAMHEEVLKTKEASSEPLVAVHSRKSVKVVEYEKIERSCKAHEARADSLAKEVRDKDERAANLGRQVELLEEENSHLRRQLREADVKIAELESLLSVDAVSVQRRSGESSYPMSGDSRTTSHAQPPAVGVKGYPMSGGSRDMNSRSASLSGESSYPMSGGSRVEH